MLILLPPSRTKALGPAPAARPMQLDALSFPELSAVRHRVADVLVRESAKPYATATLRVSPALADEIARNTRLLTDPAQEARTLYAGSLYRALDLPGFTGPARRRSSLWIVVQSPLYGALRPTDKVASYRLSIRTPLPEVAPLATRWREPLAAVLPAAVGTGLLLDCRPAPYQTAWTPRGELAEHWVRIRVPGPSRPAKHTQGLICHDVIRDAVDAQHPADLADYLSNRYDVELRRSGNGPRGWHLDVGTVDVVDAVARGRAGQPGRR